MEEWDNNENCSAGDDGSVEKSRIKNSIIIILSIFTIWLMCMIKRPGAII